MDEVVANILVVDDEIGMRQGCRRALTSQGFHVSTAEHGVEALRKLREEDYDLVLLDAMMPGMSGLEILERIYEHDPAIICVMITGYATVDLAAQAMKHGAQDFLPKPFTSDELLTVVLRGLEERKRRLDVQRQREEDEETQQLERTRQERDKLEAIASRFMLVVVHELRNPAGVIKNYLQLMRGGYVDVDEYDEYLKKLDLRAAQLLSMLDDLLELANLKGRHGLAKPRSVPLADVLERVIKRLRSQAEAKGLTLDVDVQARPALSGQAAHFESMWANLVENAIHYTPQGYVRVSLAEEGDQVVTVVADSGIGISTEELTRIFQDFYRSDKAKEQVDLGTGLGLPIVNQIVEIYQGSIQVDSTPGQGSTFTLRLPRSETAFAA
jgi:two-component system, sensor histidine kinase and response regulator